MQNSIGAYLSSVLIASLMWLPLSQAQSLEQFIEEGNKRFEQARYSVALSFYQQAETENADHPLVLHHLARTFFVLQNYNEAAYYSEELLKNHSANPIVKKAYVILGNSLEEQGNPKRALDTYRRGLKQFPDYFMLHFHTGLLYMEKSKTASALEAFQKAVTDNPAHASSHLSIGLLKEEAKQRIPSILALSTFLLLEPTGDRAESILPKLQRILQSPQSDFGNDDFEQYESRLQDWLKEHPFPLTIKMDKRVAYFDQLYSFLCEIISQSSAQSREESFFWSFYGQLWPDLKKANFIESISHILLVPTKSPELRIWLRENEEKYNNLYKWLSEYSWN